MAESLTCTPLLCSRVPPDIPPSSSHFLLPGCITALFLYFMIITLPPRYLPPKYLHLRRLLHPHPHSHLHLHLHLHHPLLIPAQFQDFSFQADVMTNSHSWIVRQLGCLHSPLYPPPPFHKPKIFGTPSFSWNWFCSEEWLYFYASFAYEFLTWLWMQSEPAEKDSCF